MTIYHGFNVTDKHDLSLKEAFIIAQDIVDDVSTTVETWPKYSELLLKDISKNKDGIRTYHFAVVTND